MTFVGSTKVGKMVMAHAAKTLTEVVLELGKHARPRLARNHFRLLDWGPGAKGR